MKASEFKFKVTVPAITAIVGCMNFGVFWFVWDAAGFWWAILYGLFWPVWVGYRLAEFLWR